MEIARRSVASRSARRFCRVPCNLSTRLQSRRCLNNTTSAASAKALGSFDVVLGADVTYNPANADALANALVAHASPSTKILLAHKRRQPADDATIKRLGDFFSITTLATGGSTAEPVSTLELRKTTTRLDLDLAGASAANCADGHVRRNGACWLARRSVGGLVAALPAVAVASVPNGVASRFESDALVQPTVDQGRSEFSGVANLYYPDWMVGTSARIMACTRTRFTG